MTTPPAAVAPVEGPRPVRVWDLVLSIVLLVLSAMLGLLLFVLSPLAASLLAVGIFVLGAAIVIGGVPGATF